jgi:hypothetical protein
MEGALLSSTREGFLKGITNDTIDSEIQLSLCCAEFNGAMFCSLGLFAVTVRVGSSSESVIPGHDRATSHLASTKHDMGKKPFSFLLSPFSVPGRGPN